MKKVTEADIKKYLKKWFRKKGKEAPETEVRMPSMKYRDKYKYNEPDIFAYKKRANIIYLIECKKATKLRYVGHAFGQILVTKLAFRKMKKSELEKKLMEKTGKEKLDDLKFEFGVAFLKQQVNASKSIQKMITMFHKLPQFKDFTVYLVSKNKVDRKQGRRISYKEIKNKENI